MTEGLAQFEEMDYAAELRTAGVEKICEMVVAFNGKRVMVLPKGAKPPKPKKKKSAAKKIVAKTKKSGEKSLEEALVCTSATENAASRKTPHRRLRPSKATGRTP